MSKKDELESVEPALQQQPTPTWEIVEHNFIVPQVKAFIHEQA